MRESGGVGESQVGASRSPPEVVCILADLLSCWWRADKSIYQGRLEAACCARAPPSAHHCCNPDAVVSRQTSGGLQGKSQGGHHIPCTGPSALSTPEQGAAAHLVNNGSRASLSAAASCGQGAPSPSSQYTLTLLHLSTSCAHAAAARRSVPVVQPACPCRSRALQAACCGAVIRTRPAAVMWHMVQNAQHSIGAHAAGAAQCHAVVCDNTEVRTGRKRAGPAPKQEHHSVPHLKVQLPRQQLHASRSVLLRRDGVALRPAGHGAALSAVYWCTGTGRGSGSCGVAAQAARACM
jgi:hypothetical protein